MHDTEEGKGDGSISGPDSGSVSGKESGKEVMEAKKKRKMKRTDIEEGEKDGELIRVHSENCLVNATEKRKKRKQDESKSKENSPENVEDHTQLTNEDGNAKTNHERKKKKKHKKKENYKDDLAASVDGGDIEAESANKGKKRKPSLVVNGSDGTSPRKSNKKVRFSDLSKGRWSQEKYRKLFDLANTDLQLKVSEEKISKHGMLRDNISWAAISDSLSSRTHDTCCRKWYRQMTSPMVAEGVWADSDDYRMLRELYSLDATCLEDVDWDGLIDNRSGDICRRRWSQMVLHIGHHGNKSFAEQVKVLAQRYCPHLLEARETWDNKPRVPVISLL